MAHAPRILVTGSQGLIGSRLVRTLSNEGVDVTGLDLRAPRPGDILDRQDVEQAVREVDGIIHLAAVSRVLDGERDPDKCWATNVEGTQHLLDAAARSEREPWLVYASSREVYGQPDSLPVSEEAPLRPVNIYGRSKAEAEVRCDRAAVRTAVVRFSNVYGTTTDHADRVVPAFARQAAEGQSLRVDGWNHTFDFTHLDDTVDGLMRLCTQMTAGASPPPIHFVTGSATTLGQLAELAVSLANTDAKIREAQPRTFDVARFVGNPARAASLLGWRPQTPLSNGLARLIDAFRVSPR